MVVFEVPERGDIVVLGGAGRCIFGVIGVTEPRVTDVPEDPEPRAVVWIGEPGRRDIALQGVVERWAVAVLEAEP